MFDIWQPQTEQERIALALAVSNLGGWLQRSPMATVILMLEALGADDEEGEQILTIEAGAIFTELTAEDASPYLARQGAELVAAAGW